MVKLLLIMVNKFSGIGSWKLNSTSFIIGILGSGKWQNLRAGQSLEHTSFHHLNNAENQVNTISDVRSFFGHFQWRVCATLQSLLKDGQYIPSAGCSYLCWDIIVYASVIILLSKTTLPWRVCTMLFSIVDFQIHSFHNWRNIYWVVTLSVLKIQS